MIPMLYCVPPHTPQQLLFQAEATKQRASVVCVFAVPIAIAPLRPQIQNKRIHASAAAALCATLLPIRAHKHGVFIALSLRDRLWGFSSYAKALSKLVSFVGKICANEEFGIPVTATSTTGRCHHSVSFKHAAQAANAIARAKTAWGNGHRLYRATRLVFVFQLRSGIYLPPLV